MSNIGAIGLYPPTINTDTLVFVPSEQEQKYTVYFELSQFNLHSDYNIVQCTVNYQQGGVSAVNNEDDVVKKRYRKTNTILMIKDNNITMDGTYSGHFDISSDDLFGGQWNNGSLYKIQMRIGQVKAEDLDDINDGYGQQDWLNTHNAEFSEWSTMVVIKPINQINVQITSLNYDSAESGSVNSETTKYFLGNILDFYGNLSDADKREVLSTYRVKLYLRTAEEENLLEDSGLLYANDYSDFYYFRYTFHQELKEEEDYVVIFEFTTENGYNKIIDLKLKCKYAGSKGLLTDLKVIVPDILDDLYGEQGITNRQLIENIYQAKNTSNEENDSIIEFPFDKFTTDLDNEEGRISIKICHTNDFGKIYNGNLMLVRTDNRSNYKHWEDIKIINLVQQDINDLDIIYDYTVESGIIYSYGLQEIIIKGKDVRGVVEYSRSMVSGEIVYLPSAITDGNTSALANTPVIRDFEHSFLLGENGVQLKLKYDNEMNSLKINVNDTKIDTIGNQYPYILRNGNSYYKTFPINGLISFTMDDNALFATEYDIYNEKINKFAGTVVKEDIVKQYYLYNKKKYGYDYETDNASNLGVVVDKNLWQYDYNYEHLFRERVVKFLTDGKPKLFKSTTEGNVIVRLMDVNTSPKQELGRLISSFTSTAHEIAEANLKNCLNYKFYNLGQIITDFSIKETKFGQVVLNISEDSNKDIISAIVDKYTQTIDKNTKATDENEDENQLYTISIDEIYDITIEFNSIAKDIDGYKIKLYNKNSATPYTTIRVAECPGIYHFDKMIKFNSDNKIEIENIGVEVIVNFLYKSSKTFKDEEYVDKIIIEKRVGQIYQNILQNNSIINLIKEKHEFTIDTKIQKILQFTGINIEANPGSLFTIRDKGDEVDTIFEIGPTGNLTLANVFNIEDIRYYGPEESVDLLIDYYFVTEQIQYQKKKKTGE